MKDELARFAQLLATLGRGLAAIRRRTSQPGNVAVIKSNIDSADRDRIAFSRFQVACAKFVKCHEKRPFIGSKSTDAPLIRPTNVLGFENEKLRPAIPVVRSVIYRTRRSISDRSRYAKGMNRTGSSQKIAGARRSGPRLQVDARYWHSITFRA